MQNLMPFVISASLLAQQVMPTEPKEGHPEPFGQEPPAGESAPAMMSALLPTVTLSPASGEATDAWIMGPDGAHVRLPEGFRAK